MVRPGPAAGVRLLERLRLKFCSRAVDNCPMSTTTSRRRAIVRDEQGFTMTEVLIVVVLIGIVVGIASASWFGLVESRRVTSATNQLVADLRLSHSSASNQLVKWHLAYMVNGNTFGCGSVSDADYCLLRVDGSTVTPTPRRLPDDTRILSTNVDTTPPLNLLTYDRAIEFGADGSARALGTLGIPVILSTGDPCIRVGADDGSPSHIVQVNTGTSRVQIDPPGLSTCS